MAESTTLRLYSGKLQEPHLDHPYYQRHGRRSEAPLRKSEIEVAATQVLDLSADRTLPFDSAAALQFANAMSHRQRAGRPISLLDAQIAALAKWSGMAHVTLNLAEFEGIGVTLIDPRKTVSAGK